MAKTIALKKSRWFGLYGGGGGLLATFPVCSRMDFFRFGKEIIICNKLTWKFFYLEL